MSTTTTNYGLTKPDSNDYYNIENHNDNMDIIDAQLKENADAAAAAITSYGTTATEVATTNSGGSAMTVSRSDHVHGLPDVTTTATTSEASLADGETFTTIDSIITDGKGRVTAKNTKTVTLPSFLSKALTGLSTASSTVITVTDTILSAIGKLQAQITTHNGLTSTAHGATSAATPSTIVVRDTSGRAKAAKPIVADDIVNKSYADQFAPWSLLQSYLTAGTYVFTAPDINGDASDYKIGIFIVGGGGSGGAVRSFYGGYRFVAASGGGSGHSRCFIMTVTPGAEYAVVVGAGGISVFTTTTGAGQSGGTSSFDGKTAFGGSGGRVAVSNDTRNGVVSGADGAQGSSGRYWNEPSDIACAYGTIDFSFYNIMSNMYAYNGRTVPNECFNPFSLERCLAAGGGANGYCDETRQYAYGQSVPTLDDGLSAGAAAFSVTPSNVTADDSTSVGCGGGAALLAYYDRNYSSTITSGAGADGAIMIYARKAVS